MYNQKGFTLIELMFVVGILGILAVIAIPVYNDYTTRAKVSEGLSLANSAKTSVTESYLMLPGWQESNSKYGMSDPEQITGKWVKSVSAVEDTITITYKRINSSVPEGSTVILKGTPTAGGVAWSCFSPTINRFHLPANCR